MQNKLENGVSMKGEAALNRFEKTTDEKADGLLRHAIAHFENEFRELEIAAKSATEARENVEALGGAPGTGA